MSTLFPYTTLFRSDVWLGPGEALGEVAFEAAWNKRGCRCDESEKRPEGRDTQGLARGYCGLCLICGEPGHTRPHPGAVEFTGSWCDFHYGVLAVTHPLAPVGTFVWLAVIAAIIFTAGQLMR